LLNQKIVLVELNSVTDSLFQSSRVSKRIFPLSNADRLLLGKKDNVEAGILIRFLFFFADSVKQQLLDNQLQVISAKVELTKNYTYGSANASFDYSVHKVNSNWGADFTSDSLAALSFDANDLSFNKTFTDSLNTFSISSEIALSWLKSYADTNLPHDKGIYLKSSSNAEKIVGFQALSQEDVPIPYLKIILEKVGVYRDTLSFFSSLDLSIISGSIADVGAENLAIQSGLNSRVQLFFDLSKLPKEASINSAQLTLTLDTLKTITGSSYANSLSVYYITDSSNLKIDSTFFLSLNRDKNTFTGSITSLFTVIKNNNQGLMIYAGDQLNGVELFAIKGSSNSSFAERPKLQINYTVLK
jgi:hypothetical protein